MPYALTNDVHRRCLEVAVNRPEFIFAVCALLLTPGPTNTLLALSGASAGFFRAIRLIPFELTGYLLVVVPLAIFGTALMADQPQLAQGIKLGAAVWIMVLAVRLWFRTPAPEADYVTSMQMFVTTLLNPKGLIFGLVLLPSGGAASFPAYLTIFVTCAVSAAIFWAAAGAVLTTRRNGKFRSPALLRFAAALWLAFISASVAAGALTG
jgi:threonine/homoserine/homoserine lactone efflux protein